VCSLSNTGPAAEPQRRSGVLPKTLPFIDTSALELAVEIEETLPMAD